MSEEVLQIEKRREGKGNGEKERYIHLNAEFQRIARRNKKAFLSDPHAATAKSLQSCPALCDPMDRAHQAPLSTPFSRQEYIEELYKKDLNDPDNHDGVITH